jgi:tetratricopeptide (TPR) repeat protein
MQLGLRFRFSITRLALAAMILLAGIGRSAEFSNEASHIELLRKALEAQDKGRDEEAIGLYQQVIDGGHVNGHLFYNLGISYYKVAKIGEAMAAFLAAKRYLPRHPDVLANLKFVQTKILDKLDATRPDGFTSHLYSLTDWFTKKEIAYLAFFATIFVSTLTMIGIYNKKYRILALYGWISFIVPCILCLFLLLKWMGDPRWGAIKAPEGAKVYSGPGDNHTLLFSLQVGAPVFLSGKDRQNFVPIEISDGKKGWVSLSQVAFFGE